MTKAPALRRLHSYYEQHETLISIGFFIGGFIFDMVMLERIDSLTTIGQQGFYLTLIFVILTQMFFEQGRPARDLQTLPTLKRWYFDYRTPLMHFFFGTLLNGYTLFFFKSSSLIMAFGFLVFMVLLLVVNESHRFKKSGLTFKSGLLTLCLLCYSAYVTPIAFGSIGVIVFLFSVLVGAMPQVALGWWIQANRPLLFESAKRQILVPMGTVLVSFLTLYMLKWIPPVPLSLPYIGVFHSLEKTPAGYRLGAERLWWKFWLNGDQQFHAQRLDKVYVFFRVFSPTRFSDQVMVRWYWKELGVGWAVQDSIPIKIVGGREEGFRGFGVKSNYQPGDWKVQVETMDGREIGRIYFTLDIAPSEPRTFEYQLM
jgi:hypothetical protein